MYTIRKLFKFEGSHALSSAYSSECKKIHGHSYVVEVVLKGERLNKDGMLIDFKMLKEKINHIFDSWDHALVVHNSDKKFESTIFGALYVDFNPTAENMAKYFYDQCKEMISIIYSVRVHETATGWAEYSE